MLKEEFQEFVTYSGVFVHWPGQFIEYFWKMEEIRHCNKHPKYGKYCCVGALNDTGSLDYRHIPRNQWQKFLINEKNSLDCE